jgi:uncharacterized protein (UPF0276 family)
MINTKTINGMGLGLRFDHFDEIIESKPKTPWFEVIVEDFLSEGPHHKKLEKLREDYPIALHSIGLNLGGVDAFDIDHLNKFKEIYQRFEPNWISDHLCWSAINGVKHHDLLPIPRTQEALRNVCERISYFQDFFNRQLVIENITAYIDYQESVFSEIDFLTEIVKTTGCGLLLDITNARINAQNRKVDFKDYFESFPLESVKQIHLSGGSVDNGVLIDSHNSEVNAVDIEILSGILSKGYKIPAMIERDADIPSFEVLEEERKSISKASYEL